MSDTPKTLYLIDGTALAYRSHFAFIRNPLINSKGVNTSSVYGFTASILKLLNEQKPDYIACMFDLSGPTFRHKLYDQYKATRQKMPDELRSQLPVIRQVVDALGVPIVEKEGFEADDVMATLAKAAERDGMDVYMVTGDKDLMQFVSGRIKMIIPGGEGIRIFEADDVLAKLGVSPEKVADYLSLTGDSSDNIPGVPGIGPKTAVELLTEFGTLDAILESVDKISKKGVREKIQANLELARLSKTLVAIDTNVQLDVTPADCVPKPKDASRLIPLFRELEFGRFLQDIQAANVPPVQTASRTCRIVRTMEEIAGLSKELEALPGFVLDLETTSLDPITTQIVGLSFSWQECCAVYVALEPGGGLFDGQSKLDLLKPALENPKILKCGQNIKFDVRVLLHHGVNVQGVDFDTMIAAYLIDPNSRRFNLDALALEYLNLSKIPTESLIGKGAKQISMAEVPVEKVAEYACEDAEVTFRLKGVLEPKLRETETLDLFRDVEMPLVSVLIELEENGVALDVALLAKMSEEMEIELGKIRGEVYELAGETFNINSTQQLGAILFDKLKVHEAAGWKRAKKTKTGYSTDVSVLESLAFHPLPKRLLDYRQLVKLKSTYIDALPRLINPKTGRLHASFNQTVAATGRLSSSDPNLQNIPIRTELGREIRKAFVPGKPDWRILSADYNQIELRILAHLSGDDTLIESFRTGEDVHRRTAAEIFGVSAGEVTDEERRRAKTINFGVIYGMGAFGLSQRLGIPLDQAQAFITAYFARYPKVNDFIASTIAKAHEQGFVTTMLSRRRMLPELANDNRNIREFAERTAVNTPIQGTAADLIKIAMIRVSERMKREKLKTMMILQIHDELVFEAPEKEIETLKKLVREEMENAISLTVPVKVDLGVGANWFEAH